MLKPILAAALTALLPSLSQAEACRAVGDIADDDFARNAAVLADTATLCITTQTLEENGRVWRFNEVTNRAHPNGPAILLPHDNENAAFDAALYAVRRYGGRLLAVEAGDSRFFDGQDPNRNFGATKAATASCRDMKRKPAPGFSAIFERFRGKGNARFYMAMHNNDNGYSGAGGRGTISARRQSTVMKGLEAPGGGGDEDDAVLLAGMARYEDNALAQQDVAHFHKSGINVIYEHVIAARNDCSYSNFVLLNKLGDYYNIEAQFGHLAQQKRMVDALMALRGVRAVDKSVK